MNQMITPTQEQIKQIRVDLLAQAKIKAASCRVIADLENAKTDQEFFDIGWQNIDWVCKNGLLILVFLHKC